MTVSADVEYTPEATGTSPNDGGNQHSSDYNSGMSLGISASGGGLSLGVTVLKDNDGSAARDKDAFEGFGMQTIQWDQ